jgi:hypothetical protein
MTVLTGKDKGKIVSALDLALRHETSEVVEEKYRDSLTLNLEEGQ